MSHTAVFAHKRQHVLWDPLYIDSVNCETKVRFIFVENEPNLNRLSTSRIDFVLIFDQPFRRSNIKSASWMFGNISAQPPPPLTSHVESCWRQKETPKNNSNQELSNHTLFYRVTLCWQTFILSVAGSTFFLPSTDFLFGVLKNCTTPCKEDVLLHCRINDVEGWSIQLYRMTWMSR